MTRELIALIICAVLMVSCSSPPKERFYFLRSAENLPLSSETTSYSVAIDRINLAESVDRPQLVLHTGQSQVELSELNRWAEPLKKSIPRVIASQLAQQLGTRRIYTYPQHALQETDYRIVIDILRLESAPSQQEVTLEALWTVSDVIRGKLKSGHSLIRESSSSDSYDALVVAHEHALASLSSDISETLRAMEQSRK